MNSPSEIRTANTGGQLLRIGGRARRIGSPAVVRGAQRGVANVGAVVKFALEVLRSLPAAARLYPSEVFRHAGGLVRANLLVILFMSVMAGAMLAMAIHYMFTNVGIGSYAGALPSGGSLRGGLQIPFGWIVAAKIGSGIVAELGAMKISEEVDAMEVMGIRPIPYLAGTRLLAALIVVPPMWVAAMVGNFFASYLLNVPLLNTVSTGGWIDVLFLFHNARDFFFALTWATVLSLIIIMIGCYYGLTAKGGAVGVGRNAAQSMLANLVLISLLSIILYYSFYGTDPNAAIAN